MRNATPSPTKPVGGGDTVSVCPAPSWREIVDRQTGLLTAAQNEIIRKTRLLMLGVGGMGMNAAAHLVRAGFERFTLVDCDVIDGTTANRTPFAFAGELGRQKVHTTRDYMLRINPAARIEVYPEMRIGLNTDPEYVRRLVAEHDVASWAMDGLAGRILYTRIAHEVGQRDPQGKPSVESWAIPWHLCVWTIPNAPATSTWEEFFALPTAGMDLADITADVLVEAQKCFLRGFFAGVPRLSAYVDPSLERDWTALRMPNRSFGPMVAGSGALIAFEMLKCALIMGGQPLRGAKLRCAPWMALYDANGHSAYEYNFRDGMLRWYHPVTGALQQEPPGSGGT